ncbi:MAG: N-acetyltransferase, partial [Candidatus Solibacter usitatus]|nr:N-acetyltransferase [Candidatus Solibacter usitatus]
MVDRLRDDGLAIVSLVAVENEEVVGHILFSELPIATAGGVINAASLAPTAVRPGRQGRGIGSALVRRGLELCRQRGIGIVVVGHPHYYPRFGFA